MKVSKEENSSTLTFGTAMGVEPKIKEKEIDLHLLLIITSICRLGLLNI